MNLNSLHTVEIEFCIKRQVRSINQKMINNLDDKFNPINVELDLLLNNQINELNEKLKHFSVKAQCSLSAMYLRIYA